MRSYYLKGKVLQDEKDGDDDIKIMWKYAPELYI